MFAYNNASKSRIVFRATSTGKYFISKLEKEAQAKDSTPRLTAIGHDICHLRDVN